MHGEPFPRVDDHIVEPETRQEMVRGVRMIAQPAKPPHADQHARLDHVTSAHVAPGYVVSTDLLTRFGPKSDFATDVCIRKLGNDPETGARFLEELAFEVVNEQSMRHVTRRAEDIVGRGVRRLIAIFVKRGTVAEWSQAEGRFVPLPLDGELDDPTLAMPIPLRALLDAALADNAVAAALYAKKNPWLMQREQEVRQETRKEVREETRQETREKLLRPLLRTLEDRNLHPTAEQLATIVGCSDEDRLARWLLVAARVGSIAELLDA